MTQRAGLAAALLGTPELVFLDEPTSGLDPLGRLLVRDVIDELRDGGATVFLNSHLLGEVEATCDRVAFVKNGRVVHELELKGAQGTLDVELRVGGVDDALLEGLAAFGTGVSRDETLVRMHVAAESVLPELARWLVARGVALYELRCRRKTLEEWFVEVMGEDQRPG
jgi:ABC-2 type transport system ATP-binding protein